MQLVPTSVTFPGLPDRLVVTSRSPTQEPTASATGASSTPMRRAQHHQETSALEVEAQVHIIKSLQHVKLTQSKSKKQITRSVHGKFNFITVNSDRTQHGIYTI